jgi:hypothetical protein
MCLQFEPLHAVIPIQINTRFCHSMSNAYLFSLSSKIATLFSIKVPSCICVGAGAGEGVAAEEDAIADLHIMNATLALTWLIFHRAAREHQVAVLLNGRFD